MNSGPRGSESTGSPLGTTSGTVCPSPCPGPCCPSQGAQPEPVLVYKVSPCTSPSALPSAAIAVHGEHKKPLPSSGVCCTRGLPPSSGGTSHFWATFSHCARGQGSPERDGGFSPSLPLPTHSGCCSVRCRLCCHTFWEPLNLPPEATRRTFPRQCMLISKGKGSFIWKAGTQQVFV